MITLITVISLDNISLFSLRVCGQQETLMEPVSSNAQLKEVTAFRYIAHNHLNTVKYYSFMPLSANVVAF